MTNLDELDRLLREATAGPWYVDAVFTVMDSSDDNICHVVDARDTALIAALRNHAEELIRDARRLEATRYQLRVEQAKFQQAIRVLSSIHAMLYPPRFTGPDGNVHEFHSPLVHLQMQEISDRIRSIPDELKALDAIAQEQK